MNLARACNQILDPSLPEWIHLLPQGPAITGADGRAWQLPDPQALIAAFESRHTPLVIDWEHASEHRAPQGLDAPAAGWISTLEARADGIWGKVEWTPRAAAQIADKSYRYLSPVFTYTLDSKQITELTSIGLTNQPNLNLTALNRKESPMALPKEITAALQLPEDASIADVLHAIEELKSALATATNRAETTGSRSL